MQALIPLISIFILFGNSQLKTDKLYRANIFSLVGICYFVGVQYMLYWFSIFPPRNYIVFLPGLVLALLVLAVAYSPWMRKSQPFKTIFMCASFGLAVVLTFTVDVQIKEKLAELGGFYKTEELLGSIESSYQDVNEIELPKIGIAIKLTGSWKVEELPGGNKYFLYQRGGSTIVEIRPNCRNNLDRDIPTYIENVLVLFEANIMDSGADIRCSKINTEKNCLVKVAPDGAEPSRWLYLKADAQSKYGSTLDITLYENDGSIKGEVEQVLSSLRNNFANEYYACRTPAAWL